MKILTAFIIAITLSVCVSAQKCDSIFDAGSGIDFMSSYVWRGIRYVSSPAIQPYMEVSAGNFTVGGWSSWHFFSGWSELDLYALYENDFIMAGVTDYYTSSNLLLDDYFNYTAGYSGHIVEVQAGYPGSEKIPLRFLAATNILGDVDNNDQELYSTFLELSYLFRLKKFDSEIRVGFTPAEGMYADNASICEVAWRMERSVTFKQDFGLKFISELTLNPVTKGMYLVGGVGIIF